MRARIAVIRSNFNQQLARIRHTKLLLAEEHIDNFMEDSSLLKFMTI